MEVVPNLGIGMDLGNFGMNRLDEGIITTSWNQRAREVKEGEERLFMLRFRGKGSARLSEVMTVSSQVTAKECYTGLWGEAEDLELEFTGGAENRYFALYQNEPNPWGERTKIGFHLPAGQMARLTIYDENGRELKVIEGEYGRGYNEVELQKGELRNGGLMYYRLETSDHVATRKMILLDQ